MQKALTSFLCATLVHLETDSRKEILSQIPDGERAMERNVKRDDI